MPRNSSLVNVITDNSKYIGGGTGGQPTGVPSMVQPGTAGVRKPAPPVGAIAGARRTTGVIDVIGAGVASRRTTDSPPPQENVIQVDGAINHLEPILLMASASETMANILMRLGRNIHLLPFSR